MDKEGGEEGQGEMNGESSMEAYTLLLLLRSHFSHVQLCVTLWTVACQAPLSMGFSRHEYWSGLPCPPPGEYFQPRDRAQASCIARRFLIV